MEQVTITKAMENQRFDKFLKKYLPNAGSSFLYKMLRKKNIVLNNKKATGKEILKVEDVVYIYFSDETLQKFKGDSENVSKMNDEYIKVYQKLKEKISIVYEDEHLLILNKPSGILSQKSTASDLSINEYAIGYLMREKNLSSEDFKINKPSICNRLDRNTSGLILFGKTLAGLQMLNELIKNRKIGKYYRCILHGKLEKSISLKGYLAKDNKSNKVTISKSKTENSSFIETEIRPISYGNKLTYVEIHLITGKTHQIRAHVASIGHPIVGDFKYGNAKINQNFKQQYGVQSQLLHAYRLVFPELNKMFMDISEKEYMAELPKEFNTILEEKF